MAEKLTPWAVESRSAMPNAHWYADAVSAPCAPTQPHTETDVVMARLYVHGEPVADYVRRSTNPGDCEVTYRLMSDGVLLQQTAWPRREARSKRATYKSRWKIAKVTPEIRANPDLLLTHGFQKE